MKHKPTENQWMKAARFLARGKVLWHSGGLDGCHATVQGDTATYDVRNDGRGVWYCECQFWMHHPSRVCSHILATELIWKAIRKGAETHGDRDRREAEQHAQ